MDTDLSRRDFLKAMAAAAAGLTISSCSFGPFTPATGSLPPTRPGVLPVRRLGSTGQSVSLLGLGGQSIIQGSDTDTAIGVINYALDLGINYIDTCDTYGGANSETNIGHVMATRRDEVFLATKSGWRTYEGVMSSCQTSLDRLQTDHVDLLQVHNIGTTSDVNELFASDAHGRTAIDAFVRLRDEGKTRFIGITGHHDPAQLLATLHHPGAPNFDTILMALNPADWHTKPFQQELLPEVVSRGMGVIAMKVRGLNRLMNATPEMTMTDALHYVYSLPVSCAIVGTRFFVELDQNAQITQDFTGPLSAQQMVDLENMTEGTPPDGSPQRGDWFKILRY